MIRIAVLHFAHETVTFLDRDTTLDDFRYPGSPCSGEAVLAMDPKGYIGGFVQVAREHPGVELVGIESPGFPKTGTGSGWITEEAYEHFTGRMVAELAAHGPWDGVYLAVHGAMGARGIPRPEAELARRVRAVVGPKACIAGTFDPHGNEDEEFFRHADFAFTVKYYPHYDAHLQGERAARMMLRAIRGDYAPAHATIRVPILSPTVLQWTGAAPWSELVQRALVWEARSVDTYVNVFFGFPWADVPDAGMTIEVTTNGDPALARRVAEDMAGWAWRKREALLNTVKVLSIPAGVAAARAAAKPAILADHSDRSGYATWLLAEILARKLPRTLVATVADGPLVARLVERGIKIGDPFDEPVGGAVDPSAGAPVRVTGRVLALPGGVRRGNAQTWIVVDVGGGSVVAISPYLVQIIEPEDLRAYGIEPGDFEIIAIKSRVHFRRGFDDSGFAQSIFIVEPDEPFLGTVRLDGLRYRNLDIKAFYPYGDPVFPPAS